MSKLNEIIDSLNDENVDEVKRDLTSEASALMKKNSQLYHRAKTAEGFTYDKGKKEWIKKEPKKEEKSEPEKKEAEKSNEPDYENNYGLRALLEQRGFKHPDDRKIIFDEARRIKLDPVQIIEMDHIKTKLKDASDQREAEEGMPKGKGRSSHSSKASEDYWIDKKNKDGSYAVPDDSELHAKIIDKRMHKIERENQFDPIR
jgi:hypothetical protein